MSSPSTTLLMYDCAPITVQQAAMQRLQQQPFFVVSDDAYDRMLAKLQRGLPAYTYLSTCPHRGQPCACPKSENQLVDGKIVRTINGVTKRVYKLSEAQFGL